MMQSPQVLQAVDSALKAQQSQQQQQQLSGAGKSSRVCRHFVRGRCTWGAACRFSHDAERSGEVSVDGSAIPSPKVSSPTFPAPPGIPMAPQQANQANGISQQTWIGAQQAQLQQQRHAILRAAMEGQFAVRPIVAPDGQSHHTIHLTTLPSPEIAIQLLNEHQLRLQLHQLELDDRVREGGLHYLIGEPSVFWSMIRHWHQTGSTTSGKWDAMLQRARQTQQVDCMFFRSAAGCLSPSCPFDHVPRAMAAAPQVMSMATSNALLQRVPSLGFGSASSDRLDMISAAQQTFTAQMPPQQAPPVQVAPAFVAPQQQAPQQQAPLTASVNGLSVHGQSSAAAALFQSTPTLDELAAAANGQTESWKQPSKTQLNLSASSSLSHREDDVLSKALWNMLSVPEPQPVPVTTAPSSHSIW